jgi:hypothetical protein
METSNVAGPQTEGRLPMTDLTARRAEVIRRLLARGVPPRALRALLPDWDPLIQEASAGR